MRVARVTLQLLHYPTYPSHSMSKKSKFLAKSDASESEIEDEKMIMEIDKEKKKIFDSSEEDEEDEEMTKEDLEFLKEASEGEEAEEDGSSDSASLSPDELSDDDLDLIEENLGKRRASGAGAFNNKKGKGNFKRLRRRNEIESSEEEEKESEEVESSKNTNKKTELQNLFNDDDSEDESELDEEDDLRDFIEEEEDDEDLPADMEEAFARKQQRQQIQQQKQQQSVPRRRAIVDDREAPKRALSSALASGQISKEAWEEMMEIFGDGTDYLDLVNESGDESEEVSRVKDNDHSATVEQESIALKDVPERLSELGIQLVEDDSEFDVFLQKESAFIAKRIQKLCPTDSFSGLTSAILSVLRFVYQHGLEVPFIATYRREYFHNFFKMNEIWVILDEDFKYRQANELKKRIKEKMSEHVSDIEGATTMITQSDREYIESALEAEWEESQLQFIQEFLIREKRNSLNKKKSKNSVLLDFAHKIVPSAARFGENARKRRVLHGPLILTEGELESEAIEVMARDAAGSVEAALSGAVNVLAEEFGNNPQLFAEIRDLLLNQADITVTPTAMGSIEIAHDPSHYLLPLQYIVDKSAGSFIEDQGLAIARGLEAKLITVDIGYGKNMRELLEDFKSYLPGNEKFRGQVFEAAWTNYWQPRLNRLVLQRLRAESETWTAHFSQFYLQEKLMVTPLNLLCKDAAIAAADGVAATSINFVNQTLFVVDLDKWGRVLRQETLKTTISEIKPETTLTKALNPRTPFVVISGEGQECVELYRDLRDRRNTGSTYLWGCDDSARIYRHSMRAAREFPECAGEMKYAVAVGRRMLDPVTEFAMMTDDELLQLPLHPLQVHLPRALRVRHLHRALVNVINLLGVAVNELQLPGSKQAILAYVSGLGPVKAAVLTKKLGARWLNSRAELVTVYEMGRRTFTNCAGFIKITSPPSKGSSSSKSSKVNSNNSRSSTQNLLEPLDGTRIHPESYELARKMAADALELDDPSVIKRQQQDIFGDDDDEDEDNDHNQREILAKAINQIMAEPKKLDDLMLPEYAKEIERLKHLPKHMTLKDIKFELQGPFPDPRVTSSSNSAITPANQIVEMLTGKNEDWWYCGREVLVKPLNPVTRKFASLVDGKGLTVGIEGDIPRHVKPGVPVKAYLTKIDLKRLIVDVSLRRPENQEELLMKFVAFDPFYDFTRGPGKANSTSINGNNGNIPTTSSNANSPRQLNHPMFKAFNRDQAEKYLEQAPVGEFLIRPSSQKRQSGELAGDLTLTWKCGPGLFAHVPLGESDRVPGQDWLLGRTLLLPALIPSPDGRLKVDRFEDLDEIAGRRIEPVVSLLQEAQGCPKFFGQTGSDAINSHLKEQSLLNPGRTPYCITLATAGHCGHLLLSHPGGSRQELIRVDPRGYALTDPKSRETKIFERIDKLVEYFKKHYANFCGGASTSTSGTSDNTNSTNNTPSTNNTADPRAVNKYQQFAN